MQSYDVLSLVVTNKRSQHLWQTYVQACVTASVSTLHTFMQQAIGHLGLHSILHLSLACLSKPVNAVRNEFRSPCQVQVCIDIILH